MASNPNIRLDFGSEDRRLDPDLFGDEDKPAKPPSDSAFISKFLKPATSPKRQKKVKVDGGIDFDERLKWANFISNPAILRSNNREKLKQYLDELLAGLNERYIQSADPIFPSNAEMTKLTQVVTVLGKALGIRKKDFGDLLSAVKRIENRWSKMPLIIFVDALRDRLLQLPVCPASVVYQAATANPDLRVALDEIRKYLNGKLATSAAPPWDKWWNTISKLQFSTASPFLTANQKLFTSMYSKADPAQKKLLAYFRLMDLRRQQLLWDGRYQEQIKASLHWIYLLQRQQDFDLLTQVFCGEALSPDKMKKVLANLDNRDRRNRSYRRNASASRRATNPTQC